MEADPADKDIQRVTVGKALLGKIGDIVEVEVPAGILQYQILEIRA